MVTFCVKPIIRERAYLTNAEDAGDSCLDIFLSPIISLSFLSLGEGLS